MRTLIASDLHLGLPSGAELLRRPGPRAEFVALAAAAERLVLLGDVLELVEAPAAAALALAQPLLEAVARVLGSRREVVIVPGNHDRALIDDWLRERLAPGSAPLALEEEVPPDASRVLASVVRALAPAPVRVAYPGVWLGGGVYATHGHYLDAHAVLDLPLRALWPCWERCFGQLPDPASPSDYERAIAGAYATIQAAQRERRVDRPPGHLAAAGRDLRYLASALPPWLRGDGGAPGAAAISAGLIAFKLRTAGLEPMRQVIERLGLSARSVVFGHVHRPGPLPGDDAGEWATAAGTRLYNTGSWVRSPPLLRARPYRAGQIVELDGDALRSVDARTVVAGG